MFDKFIRQQIETQGTIINVVHGGSGFPVLLLHGYPQTHVCWHRVAPILAEQFTVVWSADSWKEFDILEVWKSRAENVQGRAFDCGHFLPEEKPEQTAAELIRFLT
jgi:pimeloyl-ACP methyl ester carboxylesterase